jgi:hypothetical protein
MSAEQGYNSTSGFGEGASNGNHCLTTVGNKVCGATAIIGTGSEERMRMIQFIYPGAFTTDGELAYPNAFTESGMFKGSGEIPPTRIDQR